MAGEQAVVLAVEAVERRGRVEEAAEVAGECCLFAAVAAALEV